MDPGFLWRYLPGFYVVGHQAVVAGYLLQHAVVGQVRARIAHLRDDQPLVLEDGGGAGGAHALAAVAFAGCLDDGQVGFLDRLSQRCGVGGARRTAGDDVHRYIRCHLARGVAAHAVAHHVQRRRDRERVLVVVAQAADVGAASERCGLMCGIAGHRALDVLYPYGHVAHVDDVLVLQGGGGAYELPVHGGAVLRA